MLRLTVESLFITHAETNLNTIGNILNKNSTGNNHPMNNPWLIRGDEWYQGLLRRPQPKNDLYISIGMASTSTTAPTPTPTPVLPPASSSTNEGQKIISSPSSQSRVYRRPYNELQHLESIWTDTNQNGIPYSEQHRTAIQASQLANRLQHFHISSDHNPIGRPVMVNNASPQPSWTQHEILVENGLIERFKNAINDFMKRPGRRYAYNANMRWSLEHCHEISFSVTISIKKPTDIV
ncbi:unnamed protein product [Rotaria magnacalcarata]|uniref:Uncharacterized protein n=1 Tax=Rotaria magnacalcarata TaxID=392030 RepID=A0A815UTX1_9BILA|nr:unnamed protein product [Rotaria magnacalcarata]CAF4885431.1 unnamed protein product [Rotaria magnacalcarata]